MKAFRLHLLPTIVVSILVVIGLCIVFVVYAQSPNTIQGCNQNTNGSLRRVTSASQCNSSETPIGWNITGPQGIQGPVGPPGPQGPPGGFQGVSGRWEGTITGNGTPQCAYPGTNTLAIIFVQLPTGALTGSTKVGNGSASSSVFGSINGSGFAFDCGGAGVLLTGTLQDANNMSGTFEDCCLPSGTCGTWSAQRIPPTP